MDIDLDIPTTIKLRKDAFRFEPAGDIAIDRPVQAWQWMNQTRTIPDQCEWVRQEVLDAWRRCLEDYQLPLGNAFNWPCYRLLCQRPEMTAGCRELAHIVGNLGQDYEFFLKEAGMLLMVANAEGTLLYTLGSQPAFCAARAGLFQPGACWSEQVLGNNGIGTAALQKKSVAFQGMEHFLHVMHPFTTAGYPLIAEDGEVMAVICLASDHQQRLSSMFAFLHLVCVLMNVNLPLTRNQAAQTRVLEKIRGKPLHAVPVAEPVVSPELQTLVDKAGRLQQHKIPILITGESGVGKDHFVKLLRQAGPRQNQPLIAINCASIPHDLIESELFGYEAGSFTGAKAGGKPGKFMLANRGILFLDEIGDMSLDLQATLLRVLETAEITPVGGGKPVPVDVQIVAATNVDLKQAVAAGRFRRDLYYRLNGAQIHLQALRERSDRQLIIRQIIHNELSRLPGQDTPVFAQDVLELLDNHPWPGNIRQLINVIRVSLFTATGGIVTSRDLPQDFIHECTPAMRPEQPAGVDRPGQSHHQAAAGRLLKLEEWEKHGIETTLLECAGNISIAAKRLGITRTTLYKKIDRFGLNRNNILS